MANGGKELSEQMIGCLFVSFGTHMVRALFNEEIKSGAVPYTHVGSYIGIILL